MINLFFDTEFTTFELLTRQLISIGIVSEDGKHEFYAEVSDHNPDFRTKFVEETIIPLLDLHRYGGPLVSVAAALNQWIDSLPDQKINFVFDYTGDCDLVSPLIKSLKTVSFELYAHAFVRVLNERGVHTTSAVDDAVRELMWGEDSYFLIDGRQHHALVDAKASRHAFLRGLNAGGL